MDQFEVRDWFRHGEPRADDPRRVELADDDWPDRPMRMSRAAVDGPSINGAPPTFRNHETHWWDASQVYGSTPEFQRMVRAGVDGKVRLDERGLLPLDPADLTEFPGGIDGWWVGLALLHFLFMRKHNAICDRLKAEYPSWSDDRLFDQARLVNAALIAKIHTVDWTPGILGHPTLQVGMRANWWGLVGERLHDLAARITDSEVVRGIPGSPTNHHGPRTPSPRSSSPSIGCIRSSPTTNTFRRLADDQVAAHHTFHDIAGAHAQQRLEAHGFDDLRPEVYTQAGMEWIAANTMRTVLLRHAPGLAPAFAGVDNAFSPWKQTGAARTASDEPAGRVAEGPRG